MFSRKGALVSTVNRKVRIEGGEKGIDYTIDSTRNGIFLHTANVEQLSKGKRHVATMVCSVRPVDRSIAIKINPQLLKVAVVSGPNWIDPEDDGELSYSITPRVDFDLGNLEYILKLSVESL